MAKKNIYITLQEAAALLGISPESFRKLVRRKIVEPEFILGSNFAFDRQKLKTFKTKEFIKYYRYRNQDNLRFHLHPPTLEELDLLNQDLTDKLDRTRYAKEKGVTRQRLQLKIYSIAYRKMYFDLEQKKTK